MEPYTDTSWTTSFFTFLQSLLSVPEWIALAWILIVIFSFTESFKRMLTLYMSKKKRKAALYVCAGLTGFVFSFLLWPKINTIPWFVAGIISGPLSNFLHYVLIVAIKWKFPGLALILSGKKS